MDRLQVRREPGQSRFDATITALPHSLGRIVAIRAHHEHERLRNVIPCAPLVKIGIGHSKLALASWAPARSQRHT
jgi:hypothetical protein